MTAPVTAPADAVTDLLYRLEQQRRAMVSDILVHHHLNLSQWLALKALWRKGPCSMTELAQASVVDRTSLTRTVDSLIERGCVARSTPPADRRAVIVETSDKGAQLAHQVWLQVESAERSMLSMLDAERQAVLAQDLGGLLESAALKGRDQPPTMRRSRLA